MADRIRIGTASWTDKTLTQDTDWYPRKSMSAAERLRYYASIFPLVEVDATYYYPPTEEVAGRWVQRTPDGFRFDIKAYSLLTHHPTKPDSLWPDVAADIPAEHAGKSNAYLTHLPAAAVERAFDHFARALLPLHSAGKLGAVFFQFPPWFVASRGARHYLSTLPSYLPQYPLAVEFRHHSWLEPGTRDETLALLEKLGIAYVCVDGPQGFDSSVPPVTAATSDLVVVRFHGHNEDNWTKSGITTAERFRYYYDEDELAEWCAPIRGLAERARETHAIFNNCYRDYGVRNARQLGTLLGDGLQPQGADAAE